MALVFLLLGSLSPLECPRWIGDGPDVAPPGVSVSTEQQKRNYLRCYWTVIKPAERRCRENFPLDRCQQRTEEWLRNRFQWQTIRVMCEEYRQGLSQNARTLMISIGERR